MDLNRENGSNKLRELRERRSRLRHRLEGIDGRIRASRDSKVRGLLWTQRQNALGEFQHVNRLIAAIYADRDGGED